MANSIPVQNPINGKILYEIDEITDEQAAAIFAKAKHVQSAIQNMSVKARIEEVLKIRDYVIQYSDFILDAIIAETVKRAPMPLLPKYLK